MGVRLANPHANDTPPRNFRAKVKLLSPVVTGEWHAPVAVDPFACSPDEHATLLEAHRSYVRRVQGAQDGVAATWRAYRFLPRPTAR